MTDFLEVVAANAATDRRSVEAIFNETGVVLAPTAPAPHALVITRVRFAGTKHIAEHGPEKFDFDRTLRTGLWVVASRENLAGKSTVLNVIRWTLTGRQGQLRDDVRSWISCVTVEGEIDGRPFAIGFNDADNMACGRLIDGTEEIGTFESNEAFESLTGAFFTERLGLDPTPFWQQRSGGEEGEGDARRHGWQSYFPALHVRSGRGPLLGEQTMGGQAGILMQVFLGLPWALTHATSRVALNIVRRDLSAARRRGTDDARAREREREPLRQRLEEAQDALRDLEAQGPVPTPAEIDEHMNAFQRLSGSLSVLHRTLQEAEAVIALAQEAVDGATRRLAALRESAAIRPLLGRILPSECPRCTHELADFKPQRESAAHCYVCDAPLIEGSEDEEAEQEAERELADAQETLESARTEFAVLQAEERQLHDERGAARLALETAQQARPASAEREAALRELAVAEALLAQDERVQEGAHDHSDLRQRERILVVAQAEAEERRSQAATNFLARLAQEVCDLGRRFGVENLERVDPKLNATMKVTVGGAQSNFGALSPGEQLRLRIATLVGLLRIGEELGIGRFPGLLLIDSPGSEEMVDADAAEILGELVKICTELTSLQVIVATARPELIEDLVTEGRWLGAEDLGMVF